MSLMAEPSPKTDRAFVFNGVAIFTYRPASLPKIDPKAPPGKTIFFI